MFWLLLAGDSADLQAGLRSLNQITTHGVFQTYAKLCSFVPTGK